MVMMDALRRCPCVGTDDNFEYLIDGDRSRGQRTSRTRCL